ncbi:uncharacterized protein TORIP [Calliphora vicina]|uniref:uncharacterized protein TORIP n=1 Tax=Calliphora vicina TaxID=7373 RepID=UPI00325BF883
MPENVISPRPSIHDKRDTQTPQREESDQENESSILNSSQDQITTESGSDLEGFDGNNIYTSKEYTRKAGFNVSRSVPRTPKRPKPIPVNGSRTLLYTAERSETLQQKSTPNSSSLRYIILLGLVVVFAVYFALPKEEIKKVKYCSFENLQKLYPQEKPKTWRTLKVGIESILNERVQQPAVYLFAHHGGQQVFQLIKDIAVQASGCFGKQMVPIEMQSNDFISTPGVEDDYGYAIKKYKAKIKEGNVILIANLNEIPAEAARALHTICDTHSPIAKDVVIFLTLTIPPYTEGSATAKAEDTLRELWALKLGNNELDPLITRVTDQVIIAES